MTISSNLQTVISSAVEKLSAKKFKRKVSTALDQTFEKSNNLKLSKQQRQAHILIQRLIKTCWENPEFKSQLIRFPVETIEKVTGQPSSLPKGFQVRVEDQSDTSIIYLNIPCKPKYSSL